MKFLFGRQNGAISSFDPESCAEECEMQENSRVRSFAISADGVRIACGSEHSLRVWNRIDKTFIELERADNWWRLYFNNQGNLLLTIDNFSRIKCWDVDELKCLWSGGKYVHCIRWSSDDSQLISLATGTNDTNDLLLTIWEASNGICTQSTLQNRVGTSYHYFGAMCDALASIFLPSGSISIYDINLQARVHNISYFGEKLWKSCFSACSTYFACTSSSCRIRVFDVSDWTLVHQIDGSMCRYTTQVLCDDTHLVHITEKGVYLYDMATGETKYASEDVRWAAFIPPQMVLM